MVVKEEKIASIIIRVLVVMVGMPRDCLAQVVRWKQKSELGIWEIGPMVCQEEKSDRCGVGVS